MEATIYLSCTLCGLHSYAAPLRGRLTFICGRSAGTGPKEAGRGGNNSCGGVQLLVLPTHSRYASGRTSWRRFVKVRNAHRGTRTGLQFIPHVSVPLHHGMVSGRFARHPPPSASLKCRCSPQYDGLSHRFRGGSVISIAGLSRPKGTNLCGFIWPMPSARLFVPVYLSS